ncbi:hypothetical protein BC827DRAFT_1186793 [Russula dissimulans]|jgi:hypothetical protein|nr:hypothetical protein BC827DRAFT_1186793 [Russula dissimulans]
MTLFIFGSLIMICAFWDTNEICLDATEMSRSVSRPSPLVVPFKEILYTGGLKWEYLGSTPSFSDKIQSLASTWSHPYIQASYSNVGVVPTRVL